MDMESVGIANNVVEQAVKNRILDSSRDNPLADSVISQAKLRIDELNATKSYMPKFPCNFKISLPMIIFLEGLFGYVVEATARQDPHGHVVAAISRSMELFYCISRAKQWLSKSGIKKNTVKKFDYDIIDIGGNENHHRKLLKVTAKELEDFRNLKTEITKLESNIKNIPLSDEDKTNSAKSKLSKLKSLNPMGYAYTYHCCNPILSITDAKRDMDKRVMGYMNNSCNLKGEDCKKTAPVLTFIHSIYDIGLKNLAKIMYRKNAFYGIGTFFFAPEMFYCETGKRYKAGGIDDLFNIVYWIDEIKCRVRGKRKMIRFSFSEDASDVYSHDLTELQNFMSAGFTHYRGIYYKLDFTHVTSKKRTPLNIFTVTRLDSPFPPSSVHKALTFSDDKILLKVWQYNHQESNCNWHLRLSPKYIFVNKRYYDLALDYAFGRTEHNFTLQTIIQACESFKQRLILNGLEVVSNASTNIDSEDVMSLALAIYLYVYEKKFQSTQMFKEILADIENDRKQDTSSAFKNMFTLKWFRKTGTKFLLGNLLCNMRNAFKDKRLYESFTPLEVVHCIQKTKSNTSIKIDGFVAGVFKGDDDHMLSADGTNKVPFSNAGLKFKNLLINIGSKLTFPIRKLLNLNLKGVDGKFSKEDIRVQLPHFDVHNREVKFKDDDIKCTTDNISIQTGISAFEAELIGLDIRSNISFNGSFSETNPVVDINVSPFVEENIEVYILDDADDNYIECSGNFDKVIINNTDNFCLYHAVNYFMVDRTYVSELVKIVDQQVCRSNLIYHYSALKYLAEYFDVTFCVHIVTDSVSCVRYGNSMRICHIECCDSHFYPLVEKNVDELVQVLPDDEISVLNISCLKALNIESNINASRRATLLSSGKNTLATGLYEILANKSHDVSMIYLIDYRNTIRNTMYEYLGLKVKNISFNDAKYSPEGKYYAYDWVYLSDDTDRAEITVKPTFIYISEFENTEEFRTILNMILPVVTVYTDIYVVMNYDVLGMLYTSLSAVFDVGVYRPKSTYATSKKYVVGLRKKSMASIKISLEVDSSYSFTNVINNEFYRYEKAKLQSRRTFTRFITIPKQSIFDKRNFKWGSYTKYIVQDYENSNFSRISDKHFQDNLYPDDHENLSFINTDNTYTEEEPSTRRCDSSVSSLSSENIESLIDDCSIATDTSCDSKLQVKINNMVKFSDTVQFVDENILDESVLAEINSDVLISNTGDDIQSQFYLHNTENENFSPGLLSANCIYDKTTLIGLTSEVTNSKKKIYFSTELVDDLSEKLKLSVFAMNSNDVSLRLQYVAYEALLHCKETVNKIFSLLKSVSEQIQPHITKNNYKIDDYIKRKCEYYKVGIRVLEQNNVGKVSGINFNTTQKKDFNFGFDVCTGVLTNDYQRSMVTLFVDQCAILNEAHIYMQFINRIIDFTDIKNNITFHDSVPGSGKSTEIISKHIPGDLVLATGKEASDSLKSKAKEKYGEALRNYDSNYRTVTSFLKNPKVNLDGSGNLFIDECFMSMPGYTALAIIAAKPDKIHLYGDSKQIPYIHRDITNVTITSLLDVLINVPIEHKIISYRCPQMIGELMLREKFYNEFICDSTVVGKISRQYIRTVTEIPVENALLINKTKGVYLTFTQQDKSDLINYFKSRNVNQITAVHTIHEFQGEQCKSIALVRLQSKDIVPFDSTEHIIVALTRCTIKFMYYSVRNNDTMWKVLSSMDGYGTGLTRMVGPGNLKSYDIMPKATPRKLIPVVGNSMIRHYIPVKVDWKSKPDPKLTARFLNKHNSYSFEYSDLANKKINPEDFVNAIRSEGYDVVLFTVDGPAVSDDMVRISELMNENGWFVDPFEHTVKSEYIHFDNVITSDPSAYRCDPWLLQFHYDIICKDHPIVDMSYDSYHVHNGPLNICTENIKLDRTKMIPPEKFYGFLRPLLKTSMPYNRHRSATEMILALQKRNGNAPRLAYDTPDAIVGKLMFDNLIKYTKLPRQTDIGFSQELASFWLSGQKQNCTSDMIGEEFWCYAFRDLTKYGCTIKPQPKPKLDVYGKDEAVSTYLSLQTIACQGSITNVTYCSIFKEIKSRFIENLPYKYKIFSDLSSQEFCTLMDEMNIDINSHIVEVDMGKYDKSQTAAHLYFEYLLYEHLGLRGQFLDDWMTMHISTTITDKQNKVSMKVDYQRKSGDAATFFGNTLVLMGMLMSTYNFDDIDFACFAGDDSLLIMKNKQKDPTLLLGSVFNMEAKLLTYVNPYFCSKFLLKTSTGIKLVPDPFKILVKLGRHDIRNFEHLKEYKISMLDLLKEYKNVEVQNLLSIAATERYNRKFSLYLISYLYYAFENLEKFFYHEPGDVLLSGTNFSLD